MSRVLTHRIVLAAALGYREHVHGVLDTYLGEMPGGRPVVRLDVPLERLDAPGVVAAWASATGARAEVYGPVLGDIMADAQPSPTAVDAVSPISHVRWPSAADQALQANAVGYVITQSRDDETGEWSPAPDLDALLAMWQLARLSGTPEEQAAAIAAADAFEDAHEVNGVGVVVEVGL